jgi:RNA polymerase sigma factor (sigma-70 family)
MGEPPSDARLLRESRRDPDAFVTVCERHAGALHGWLRRQTRSDDVAAELLAETLAEAWRVRRRFRDPGDGSAAPWLFGIARNLLSHYRRRGAVAVRARERLGLRVEPAHDPYEEVDERVSTAVDPSQLEAALAALPASQREALTMRVVGEREYEEIAGELEVSPATARTRVFRALGALRARLEGGDR